MNKQQKIRIGIIAAGFVLVVAIVAVVMVTVGGSANAYNSHMELAQQYLDELQYEQAIAEYRAAIEIEPKNEEAYLALADIYVQQGDYEATIAVLNQGLEETGAEELKVQIEAVSKQYEEVLALQTEQERKEAESAEGETGNSENAGSGRQEIIYNDDGTIGEIVEFDGNGNIIKDTQYLEGEVSWYVLIEYYENGNVKDTFYDSSGVIYSIKEYDKNGQIVEDITY